MKLLFIHGEEKLKEDDENNYYTDGSYSNEVWQRYAKLSEEITVMFRKDEKIYKKEEAEAKFQIFDKEKYRFEKLNNTTQSIRSFFNLKSKNDNKKLIEENVLKSDFVIARVPSNASYIAIKFAQKYNKPYIIEVVGCPRDTLWNHSWKGKILAIFAMCSLKNITKKAQYVIYVSNEFLQKRYPSKGKKIACSDVVLKETNDSVLEKRLKRIENKQKNDKIILGTVGAIDVKYKGQQYVIKAIGDLNKQGYNFEYHLVGGGDNKYLKDIAKTNNLEDSVKFIGSLRHEEIFEFLDNIDVYIQPSKTEGMPRALIEAMSRGCYCIGSNVGGIPELLSKDNVFAKGNIKKLKNVLKRQINKQNMKTDAYKNINISKNFDKNILEKKRNDFYNEFLKENQIKSGE